MLNSNIARVRNCITILNSFFFVFVFLSFRLFVKIGISPTLHWMKTRVVTEPNKFQALLKRGLFENLIVWPLIRWEVKVLQEWYCKAEDVQHIWRSCSSQKQKPKETWYCNEAVKGVMGSLCEIQFHPFPFPRGSQHRPTLYWLVHPHPLPPSGRLHPHLLPPPADLIFGA